MADATAEDPGATVDETLERDPLDAMANGEPADAKNVTENGTAPIKDEVEDVKPHVEAFKNEEAGDVKLEPKSEADIKDEQVDGGDKKRKEPPVSVSAHERHERNKRPRGGASYQPRKSNIPQDRFSDLETSTDAEEIRRQVEFYFSDSNLPIDAYLLGQTGGHRNMSVPLKTIHNFKRMRHFQPYSIVQEAVKASKFLDLDDKDEITRKVPLSDKFTDDPQHNRTLVHTSSMPRSIYAKGFGEENKGTHLEIESFFEPYGPVSSVRLRRSEDGAFKGSVFIEFSSEEGQQRFLDLDPKPQWQPEGAEEGKDLEIMSKQEYVDMKHQGIMDGSVRPRSPTHGFYERGNKSRGRGRGRDRDDRRSSGGGKRDWIPEEEWRARRDQDQEKGGRNERERRGRGGRGRGDRDRGGRGGSGGRDRRGSPEFRDRKRRGNDGGDRDDIKQDTAEDVKVEKTETIANGDAAAGAAVDNIDKISESKKRAAAEDVEEGGREPKKVKEEVEA